MQKIRLGHKYKDVISGYEGFAVAIIKYYGGLVQVKLEGSVKDNVYSEGLWFNICRMKKLDSSPVILVETEADFSKIESEG